MTDSAVTDLPEPDSPTSASGLALGDVERDAVDGERRAAALMEGDGEVVHDERSGGTLMKKSCGDRRHHAPLRR